MVAPFDLVSWNSLELDHALIEINQEAGGRNCNYRRFVAFRVFTQNTSVQ